MKLQSVDLRVADVEATARFFADVWGLTRVGSNRLRGSDALPYLVGRSGVSPEMAVRLSIAFGTSAESWLNHQVQHDLSSGRRVGPSQLLDFQRKVGIKGVVQELRSCFLPVKKGLLRKIDAAREPSFSTRPRLVHAGQAGSSRSTSG